MALKRHKSPLTLALLTLVIAAIVLAVYFLFINKNENVSENNIDSTSEIDFGPPTDEEKAAGDKIKEDLVSQENNNVTEEAQVVIADASQYGSEIEVRAFVSNLVSDGTCVYSFSFESESFSLSQPAKADASTTTCLTLVVPLERFNNSGKWSVEVTYNGNVSGSSSTEFDIEL